MPRKSKKKSASRRKKRKVPKRPYKLDKVSRARHAYRRPRNKSRVKGHHKRLYDEAELTNFLLNSLLKTASSTEDKPYNYHPRHHSKDPEYAFYPKVVRGGRRRPGEMQEFKQGFPAPDVSMLRPQGEYMPPHRGNFPGWQPEWVHTYQHPHAG